MAMSAYEIVAVAVVAIWGGSTAICSGLIAGSFVSKAVERSIFGEGGRPNR